MIKQHDSYRLTLPKLNGSRLTQLVKACLGATLMIGLAQPALSAVTEAQTTSNTTNHIKTPVQPTMSVSRSDDGIVALVNDTPILKSEFNAALAAAKARFAETNTDLSAQRLQNEVLNQLILRELQLDMAKRAGIRPTPESVNLRLAEIAKGQGLNSLTALQQALDAQQAGSYAAVRNKIIEEESIAALQQSRLRDTVRITEQDVDAFLNSPEAKQLQRTEYRTIHIRIPFTDDYSRIDGIQKMEAMQIANQVYQQLNNTDDAQQVIETVTNGVAQNYPQPLQGGDMGFHEARGLPTALAALIPTLSKGEVTEPKIVPEGIDVVKLVDTRNNETTIIPQWRVRHILISTNETNSDELARQKIEDIYNRLKRGASFSALASTYSDDPGSAGRGGDLSWVTEGKMVPEFEAMMKQTNVGNYSEPFQTQFGWHILQVDERRQKDISTDVKRDAAREALFQRLAPQVQEDWLQELKSNAYIHIVD